MAKRLQGSIIALVLTAVLATGAMPVCAAGGAAQASAAVRVVGAAPHVSAAPFVLSASSTDSASGVGQFTVTNPGQESPWFLTLRAADATEAIVVVQGVVLSTQDQTLASAASGAGGGQYVVQPDVEIYGNAATTTTVVASVTSGP